jgi:hypothetical protein
LLIAETVLLAPATTTTSAVAAAEIPIPRHKSDVAISFFMVYPLEHEVE